MSKRGKLNRSKSRRTTPWDDSPRPTPVQRFIKVHYQTRYEERHQPLDETGEAEMINSFERAWRSTLKKKTSTHWTPRANL